MKLTTRLNNLAAIIVFLLGVLVTCQAADPIVSFTWPADGQGIVTLAELAGTASSSGQTIQEVVFSIYDQSTGQYWNGTDYQGTTAWLPTTLTSTTWTAAGSVALPGVVCGHQYQLTARAADTASSTNIVNINVHADAVQPAVSFTGVSDGQSVSDLSAMAGTVSDNFNAVQLVVFSIHELDINGGEGRWWNGTQFQSQAITLPAQISGGNWSPAEALPALNSGQTYELTAQATDTTCNNHSVTVKVHAPIAELSWDPGLTPVGTVLMPNPNTNGGNYWFKIVPHNPSVGVWRTALTVQAGEADVYMSQSSQPTISSHSYGSSRTGSDGFVLDASQFDPAQEWFILVHAAPEAQWTLATGDIYVYDLGPVATDASSGATTALGAEGMFFFKTTVDSETTAWRLWLQGAQNWIFVKKSLAPHPVAYELAQPGQMLIVPPYLAGASGGTYFIAIAGDPGTTFSLDSRKHAVTDLAFNSLTNLVVGASDYPYLTFRVQVPVQQIAWQLNLAPTAGQPNIAVRRDLIPNEFRNDAFSETPEGVGASVSLVPPPPDSGPDAPGLSDGTFFVTVYSTGPFACGFSNSNPVITDVPYLFAVTNDTPARSGWRYYRVSNIAEQLGSLGWELLLSNQVAGTEIALRRNAVPGRWTKRNIDNDFNLSETLGNVDYSGTGGFLQRPAHQADIWYIGVYTPADALGNFVLSGGLLTGQLAAFDGPGSSVVVTDEPAGRWRFFRIDVPAGALGWDVRVVGVTAGSPQMVVSRDTLPSSLETAPWVWWQPMTSAEWPSGHQWGMYGWDAQWSGCGSVPVLAMGMGNPLQPGTYYIGVKDPNSESSYTLQSRGIGTGYAIPVRDLDFAGGTQSQSLAVMEGDYYRVVVPGGAQAWKLRLKATTGDVLLKVQKDALPNSGYFMEYGSVYRAQGGQPMIKAGDEHWALMPERGNGTVTAGTYYAVVVGQGQDATNHCTGPGTGWGGGTSSYQLSSAADTPTLLTGVLSYGNDLLLTGSQQGGEMKFYQFDVPAGIASVELRLENRVGNPVMYLNQGPTLSGTLDMSSSVRDPYGNYGGTNYLWRDGSLLTVANANGTYKLSVFASSDESENFPDASYVLRVHAVPPTLVAFDGGSASVSGQPAGTWQFFQVNVPADAVGWDVRLVGITNGDPQMVVSRDTLPSTLETSPWVWWQPMTSTEWPSGYHWGMYGWDAQWSGCGSVPVLAMGMGNPLQPGTYYVGVKDPNAASSYTVQSRGIGGSYSIPVRDLDYATGVHSGSLAVADGDYFKVVLPEGLPDWKLKLRVLTGDVLLKVQKDSLPNSGHYMEYGGVYRAQGGQPMIKAGDEHWALMPENGNGTVTAGTYYAVVVGQGQDTTNHCTGPGTGWGGGTASYHLSSLVETPTIPAGVLSFNSDLVFTNTQQGGEVRFYQFNVPAGTPAVEVRLENRVGNPVLYLNQGLVLTGVRDSYATVRDPYGNYGGTNVLWWDRNLITVPNPQSSMYSLSVVASKISEDYPDAAYVLRVRAPAIPILNFSSELNTNGQTNAASGVLADNQRAFYQVQVPASVDGAPVLGWKLDLSALDGTPSVRVRKDLLPDEGMWNGTSPFNKPTATIVPPYLSPGTWYVEVKGGGATNYKLVSSVITTNTLDHPLWVMPEVGQTTVTPGLTFPVIGDSGVDATGNPLPGDQGIDLEQGNFDYYAVVVPANNGGTMRTELQAISGNPNLYLRTGAAAPTLAHNSAGVYGDQMYERSLTGNTTEYGNWVPLKGRYESRLTPGIWVLAVQAGGNANARYRLVISCGNPTANGLVQNLPLEGGSLTAQNLNGGDWRYYRVQIPSNAPANWVITWSRNLGSARLFVRDTVPPGDGNSTRDYSDPNYNPGPDSYPDLRTWNTDRKNQGPYPRFDSPGTYQILPPPLRPGSVYYLGFWSPDDTTFSVSSSTSGGAVIVTNTIAFNGGVINTTLPAYGSGRYRIEVPASASHIVFNANHSANVMLALEQGTLAQPGGPAHWNSYNFPWGPNQPNASLSQSLLVPNNWPWLPGSVFYLAVTNTSGTPESLSAGFAAPSDLSPIALVALPLVSSTQPSPAISLAWCVTNQGTATAPDGWYDRVWFSTNGVLDTQSISLGDLWFGQPLAAGAGYWQTNMVNLPLAHTADYWLFVEVDFQNQIHELDKVNNVSAPFSGRFELQLPRPTLDCVVGTGGLTFTWTGPFVLQSSTNAVDSYEDLPEASSPYNAPIAPEDQRYFRLRGQ